MFRLRMLARKGEATSEERATAFAHAVNTYVPITVGLPLSQYER